MTTRVPALSVALGVLLLLGLAAPVLGHVSLVASDPEAGATVPRVDTVTLLFNEALKESASSFKLVGPDGGTIGTGTVTGPRRMVLDSPDLEPGDYTVKWTAAGDDGHIERGRFTFTVAAAAVTPAPATPSPSPSPAPSDGPAATARATDMASVTPSPAPSAGGSAAAPGAPSATPAASASPATDPASASGTDVLIPIVAALVIVGLVGLLVLRRSRTA